MNYIKYILKIKEFDDFNNICCTAVAFTERPYCSPSCLWFLVVYSYKVRSSCNVCQHISNHGSFNKRNRLHTVQHTSAQTWLSTVVARTKGVC